MSQKEKRNRYINWDEEEEQLFRSVLKEYAPITENKALDNNSNKSKTKAWEEFHKKFNNLNGRPRSLNQLKMQWKTMKMNARKTMSSFKKETSQTGGGVRPKTPSAEVVDINDLLNPVELLRDGNIHDSDRISMECVNSMVNYSKILKDQEHQRRLEIMEAEHKIHTAIQAEKLKSAILEIRKARGESL